MSWTCARSCVNGQGLPVQAPGLVPETHSFNMHWLFARCNVYVDHETERLTGSTARIQRLKPRYNRWSTNGGCATVAGTATIPSMRPSGLAAPSPSQSTTARSAVEKYWIAPPGRSRRQ